MKSTESAFLMSRYCAISSLLTGSRSKRPDPMALSSFLLGGTLSLPHDSLQPAPDCANLYGNCSRISRVEPCWGRAVGNPSIIRLRKSGPSSPRIDGKRNGATSPNETDRESPRRAAINSVRASQLQFELSEASSTPPGLPQILVQPIEPVVVYVGRVHGVVGKVCSHGNGEEFYSDVVVL